MKTLKWTDMNTRRCRRLSALTCGITFLLVFVFYAEAATNGSPTLVCADPVYDFGASDGEKAVEHSFVLKNEGNAPIEITKVQACCGASADATAKTIQPGSNTTVKASYSLHGRSGRQWKSIYVHSTDPNRSIMDLKFTGIVTPAVDIQPASMDFGSMSSDSKMEKEVRIVSVSNIVFHITNIVSTATWFKVEYQELHLTNTHSISVTTMPPFFDGVLRGTIQVQTDNSQHSRLEIPVTGLCSRDIIAVPTQILLARNDGSSGPVGRYLALRSRSKQEFHVLEVKPPDSSMTVKITADKTGGYTLKIGNIFPSASLDSKTLTIKTDHSRENEIQIPFRVSISDPSKDDR